SLFHLSCFVYFYFFYFLYIFTIFPSLYHIQNYYDTTEIGTFPKRLKPISLYPKLTDKPGAINYKDAYECLNQLNLAIYTPTKYILPSRLSKYVSERETEKFRVGRESGIQRLMSINLLKRMESSVHSFLLTLQKIYAYMCDTSDAIDRFQKDGKGKLNELTDLSNAATDFDEDDQNTDIFTVGKKVQIDLRDMDYLSWQREIKADVDVLATLIHMTEDISPEYDFKLNQLFEVIRNKEEHPINPGNKKILIFTAFANTAEYLYENIAPRAKEIGLNTALVTGSIEGKTTIPNFRADMNHVLTCFSPMSKDRDVVYPEDKDKDIDILIATDCISEGQNLQDCDYCINYDIHWNPVRIIQRFGRIDRIGSKNKVIQLVNFWPDLTLDEYINLKDRVETRMKISVMTSTGDDDLINPEEKGDLNYRKAQLKRLQEEVVDLEDMNEGISITDLGLNDFRMDLLAYMKEHKDLDHLPFGIHAVVHGDKPGVIFVLKNVNKKINIKDRNRLHPFYMVYVDMDGEILVNHLQPKDILDEMRHLAKGRNEPDKELCKEFNRVTKDGRQMQEVSRLLEHAIGSIIEAKNEEDIESFFSAGTTTFQSGGFSGLDDFELIDFLVVM
ncbi:SWF/SNF helicase family protein, partial [Lactobacillus delbrueckii subsp. lactis]|nr:SWF/SNF helicase family protein [Lactobacillus delbrueckii subsp. lactis]